MRTISISTCLKSYINVLSTNTQLGIIYEQSGLLRLPTRERIDVCISILKKDDDESLRGEAVWVLGATASQVDRSSSMWTEIADALEYVLANDANAVVKHEACFQIGEHNITTKIPALLNSALHDPSELVRHEAVEAMGLLQLFDHRETLRKAQEDSTDAVRQTATFVMKQLDRLEAAKAVRNSA